MRRCALCKAKVGGQALLLPAEPIKTDCDALVDGEQSLSKLTVMLWWTVSRVHQN